MAVAGMVIARMIGAGTVMEIAGTRMIVAGTRMDVAKT